MADFVAVLKKTLDGLSDTTPLMREKVYEKARITIASKLATMNPPLPEAVIAKQKQALDEAIVKVEEEYRRKSVDPLTELDDVFASLKNPDPRAVLKPPVARPAPVERSAPPPAARPLDNDRAAASAAWVQQPVPAATAPLVEKAAPVPPPERTWPAAPAPVVKVTVATLSRPAAREEDSAPAVEPPPPPPKDWFRPVDEPDDQRPAAVRPAGDVVEMAYPADGDDREEIAGYDEPVRRRGYGRLVAAVAVLALLAGAGYGLWVKQDQVRELLTRAGITIPGLGASTTGEPAPPPAQPDAGPASDVAAVEPAEQATPEEPPPEAAPEPASPGAQKFTQRLNPDGTETDPGAAGGSPMIGEGTSIAAVTQPSAPEPPASQPSAPQPPPDSTEAPAAPDAAADVEAAAQPPADAPAQPTTEPSAAAASAEPPADTPAEPNTPSEVPDAAAQTAQVQPSQAEPAAEPSIPVSQKAIFYEERTNTAEASAESGSIVWSLVQESPGGDLPPEPAIRAEATIPGKDVQLRMTIRRNADQSLPASHIVEMIFLMPEGFEGGGIESVLRISLKGSEQEAGSPLLGIPAKIGDGFFLIALNDTKPEIEANSGLAERQVVDRRASAIQIGAARAVHDGKGHSRREGL